MKVSEMNQREKKAFYNIKHAANDLLGGLENTLLDYGQDDPEYKSAKAQLSDHEGLVTELYGMATTAIYGEGYCCFNPATVEKELRDINFCGKAWLMERCDKRITKEGY